MIKLLRVDDRLIHGQVAMTWTSYLHAKTIVVADDASANDAFATMALNLAKPPGTNLLINTVNDAIGFLTNVPEKAGVVFVVCATTDAALALCKGCEGIQEIVMGGIRKAEGKRYIERQVFLDEKDMENIQGIEDLGRHIYVQVVPSEKSLSMDAVRSIYQKAKA